MLQNRDSNFDSSAMENPMDLRPAMDMELFIDLEPVGEEPLTWESPYAIALALRRQHPQIDLEQVSLGMIYRWTVELPEFSDDRELANEAILAAIYQEWFEEEYPL
jgi:FeS assembly protein IscX